MYAKYACLPLSDIGNVMADIKAILTGTTNKSLLSVDCDQANTYIISNVAAGWPDTSPASSQITSKATNPLINDYLGCIAYGNSTYLVLGGGNSNITSSLRQSSSDLLSWASGNIPSPNYQNTRCIYAAGKFVSVSGWMNNANSGSMYSADGITWTNGTGVPSGYWKTLAYSGTIFVSFQYQGTTATYMTSADGQSWTSRTLTGAPGMADCCYGGGLFVALPTSGASAYTSSDGLSWTTRSISATALSWQSICYGNGMFIAVASNGSIYQSTNAITWQQVASLGASRALKKVLWCDTYFLTFTSETVPYYAVSPDGINWYLRVSHVSTTGNYPLSDAIWDGSKVVAIGGSGNTPSTQLFIFSPELNVNLRALNTDGVSYKYVNVDVASGNKLVLRAAESFAGVVHTNLIYDSDNTSTAAQLDLTNGSILFIGAKKEYIAIYSYLPATSTFGSSTSGIWNAVCEYSRDDAWNTNYPPYVYLQSDSFANSYVPRLKSAVGIDQTGSTAKLALQPTYSLTKQALNSAGDMPVHTAVDMRFSNTNDFTYTVLGGKLLGGFKRTTDSFGTNLDETLIGSTTYVVWNGGSGNTTFRFLVPKE